MPTPRSTEAREIVYLLAEVAAGGRIHEIGSRALLLEAEVDRLTLALDAEAGSEHVSCPAAHVQRGASRPHPARTAARPGFTPP